MNNKKPHLIGITFIILAIFCFYLIGYAHNVSVELEQQEQLTIKYQVELEKQEQLTIKYQVESQNNLEKVNELMVKNFNLQYDIDMLLARNPFDYIESLKEYNKESYMYAYLSICDMIEDAPEKPQDMMSVEEYDMFCRIVEAEIGIGDFDEKLNVTTTIANRYYGDVFPNDWMELFKQKNQFSTYSSRRYLKVTPSKKTELAIAYALMVDDYIHNCTYFRAGKVDEWEGNDNLEFVFYDGMHSFFKDKRRDN